MERTRTSGLFFSASTLTVLDLFLSFQPQRNQTVVTDSDEQSAIVGCSLPHLPSFLCFENALNPRQQQLHLEL